MNEKTEKKAEKPKSEKLDPVSVIEPAFAGLGNIFFIQRRLGNQGALKYFKAGVVQAKLNVSDPCDIYEQEADRVADKVMRMTEPQLQKHANDKHAQKKDTYAGITQLSISNRKHDVEDDNLQFKAENEPEVNLSPETENRISSLKGRGEPLSATIRTFMEPRFGADFSDVRIHTDASAGQLARHVNAKAFTAGNEIVFAQGYYDPQSEKGKTLLAHELTHVIQQSSGNSLQLNRDTENKAKPGEHVYYIETTGTFDKIQPEIEKIGIAYDLWGMYSNGYYLLKKYEDGKLYRVADIIETLDENGTANGYKVIYYVSNSDAKSNIDENSCIQTIVVAPRKGKTFTGDFEEIQPALKKHNINYDSRKKEGDSYILLSANKQIAKLTFQNTNGGQWNIVQFQCGSDKGDPGAPQWAYNQFAKVDRKIKESSKTPNTPDKIVLLKKEENKPQGINVWVDSTHKQIDITEGESADEIIQRIEKAVEDLRKSRDANESVKVEKGAAETGFYDSKGKSIGAKPGEKIPGENSRANTPEYPSKIEMFPSVNENQGVPQTTVTGARNRFSMVLDYSPAGADMLHQIGARFQPIDYYWEVINVTWVEPDKFDETLKKKPAGSGKQFTDWDSIKQDYNSANRKDADDNAADLRDLMSGSPLEIAATWQARAAWLGVIGISNVVREIGKPISSFVSNGITKPVNEQSIGFSEEGTFIVRCVATPVVTEKAQTIRASSIAVKAVRVESINKRALEVNNTERKKIDDLKAQLEKLADGEDKEKLSKRIEAMEKAQTATVGENAASMVKLLQDKISLLNELDKNDKDGVSKDKRSPEVRLLDVQLQILQIPRDQYRKNLDEQLKQFQDIIKRSTLFANQLFIKNQYKPQVTFVSEEDGSVTQMLMMLGQGKGPDKNTIQWHLVDITSPKTQQYYSGTSKQEDVAGHQEAIRNAFVNFRENAGYGRGTIAIHLPENLKKEIGDIQIEEAMRASPGSLERAKQRLSDLAEAAAVAGLVISGPAGIALGAVGGVASAAVAIDNMYRRSTGNRFEFFSFETMMDIVSVVGAAAAVTGVGILPLRTLPGWVKQVKRVEKALYIFGVGQTGLQVITIPVQLISQLESIDKVEGISEGEKSARRAEALLGAVKSGIMTYASAAQMLNHATETAAESGAISTPGEKSGLPAEPAAPEKAPSGSKSGAKEELPSTGGVSSKSGPTTKRLTGFDEILGDLKDKVTVVENAQVNGARVRYLDDDVVIEVGKMNQGSQSQQIKWHLSTARVLLKYKGTLGKVRILISRIFEILKISPGYGKLGFESRLEVQKLRAIIKELEGIRSKIEEHSQKLSDSGKGESTATKEIDSEISNYEKQLADHESQINSYKEGRGFVAAETEQPPQSGSAKESEKSENKPPDKPQPQTQTPESVAAEKAAKLIAANNETVSKFNADLGVLEPKRQAALSELNKKIMENNPIRKKCETAIQSFEKQLEQNPNPRRIAELEAKLEEQYEIRRKYEAEEQVLKDKVDEINKQIESIKKQIKTLNENNKILEKSKNLPAQGTDITDLVRNGKKTKPKSPAWDQAPNWDKWVKEGGRIIQHPDSSITYVTKEGIWVTYNKEGYPDFSNHCHPDVDPKGVYLPDGFDPKRNPDYRKANKMLGKENEWGDEAPDGYRWHHNEDGHTMQLVKRAIHELFTHAGGISDL